MKSFKLQLILTFKNIKTKSANKIETSDFDPEVKVVELKKVLSLFIVEVRLTPTFVLHTYIKGGLAHEDENNNGIYNLLGRTFHYGYKGTTFEK